MFRSKILFALIMAAAPSVGGAQDLRRGRKVGIQQHVQRNAQQAIQWDDTIEQLASRIPSDAPSNKPSFAPMLGEEEEEEKPRAPISFFDKPSDFPSNAPSSAPIVPEPSDFPSDAPSSAPIVSDQEVGEIASDVPSDAPSSAPLEAGEEDDPSGPVSVFDKPDEIKEDAVEEAEESGNLCPVNDFLPFVPPNDSVSLFNYTLSASDAAVETTKDIIFNVSSYCEYMVYDFNRNKPYDYDTPNDWIDGIVLYFGGIPRASNGATLNGLVAPTASDISVVPYGNAFFEVTVSASSDAVDGDEPLSFGFPTETKAVKFQLFLLSILETAPKIFLKNIQVSCGSGPTCVKLDKDVCFYNPRREKLGLMEEDGKVTYYDNSLEWFNNCAKSLGCNIVYGNEQLLYFGVPAVSVKGTTFQFGREDGVDPVEWECYNVQAAHALLGFIQVAAKDPFKPLGVGGVFQSSEELQD